MDPEVYVDGSGFQNENKNTKTQSIVDELLEKMNF